MFSANKPLPMAQKCKPLFISFFSVKRAVRPDCLSVVFRENLPSRFKFKEYCPMVFRNLRERFCIDDQDYQVTLPTRPMHVVTLSW